MNTFQERVFNVLTDHVYEDTYAEECRIALKNLVGSGFFGDEHDIEQSYAMAQEAAGEMKEAYGWCTDGFREVMLEIGLPVPKQTEVQELTFRVAIRADDVSEVDFSTVAEAIIPDLSDLVLEDFEVLSIEYVSGSGSVVDE